VADALRFASGTATLDATATTMAGTWAAQINAGQGLRTAPATFTGTR
jgi:hypothetical protein